MSQGHLTQMETTWEDSKEKTESGQGATTLRPHKTSGNLTGHKKKGGKEREEKMLRLCTPSLIPFTRMYSIQIYVPTFIRKLNSDDGGNGRKGPI